MTPIEFIVFLGASRIAAGDLAQATAGARKALARDPQASVQVFNARTGAIVDLDLREDAPPLAGASPPPPRRGRPPLGVVAREVTLLPRHWEWLAEQPGGASAALRRLVEAARKSGGEADRLRSRRDAAYRFMAAMAGDAPGFEEASRALFAGDDARLETCMSPWPADVRAQVLAMLRGA